MAKIEMVDQPPVSADAPGNGTARAVRGPHLHKRLVYVAVAVGAVLAPAAQAHAATTGTWRAQGHPLHASPASPGTTSGSGGAVRELPLDLPRNVAGNSGASCSLFADVVAEVENLL
ncbi:hypothetical protein ABZY09_43650 [Streptomyces sp. NPDC002928]|uniref:hypothetical protein n=1 Tax=Streptomyces sp. NPDC002928 TaxID=3154440 RepID=UPI0033ACDDB2